MWEVNQRLPVYILLDCSASMVGEPIEAAKQGVKALLAELRTDLQTAETVSVSMLLFDSYVRQTTPPVPVKDFQEPVKVEVGGVSKLGKAVQFANSLIKEEITALTQWGQEIWMPHIFIFTDGKLTDKWMEEESKIPARKILCMAGANTDTEKLRTYADEILLLNTLAFGGFSQCFLWEKLPPLQ